MKTLQKLSALFIALAMCFGLSLNVYADDQTGEIVITSPSSDHIYEAYQILTGDVSGDTLSNIKAGANFDTENDLDAAIEAMEASADNAADYVDSKTNAVGYADTSSKTDEGFVYTISGLKPGYYLVQDQEGSQTGTDSFYTNYVVRVVGKTVNVTTKGDVTRAEKKVKDVNDSTKETTDWQDSADFDFNDVIDYQLKATLANNVADYDEYQLIFTDTLSSGLDYQTGTATVSVNGEEVSDTYYSLNYDEDTRVLTIEFENVKNAGATNGSIVTVDYQAKLNENAVIGSEGNPNTLEVTYSNNPTGSGTGKTTPDTVKVFTYQLVVNKVDADDKPLSGAQFTLYKFVAQSANQSLDLDNLDIENIDTTGSEWQEVDQKQVSETDQTTFTFEGLDDGIYYLKESTTPSGYNTSSPILFTVLAEHEESADDPELISLTVKEADGITSTEKVSADAASGTLTSDVVNQAGTTLPRTGGMGTTILYTVGAILVIGAGILLITRMRMKNSDK